MAVAVALKEWTLEELHSLPDDGNKYELIDGELFVTPAPAYEHEEIAARLTRILVPYVAEHGLGYVFHPRAVVQRSKSEVEPDLQVCKPHPEPKSGWAKAPIPLLVVEIVSPYTWRRDRDQKKRFYARVGVSEYWMVDPEERTISVARRGEKDSVATDRLEWFPSGASAPLWVELEDVFP